MYFDVVPSSAQTFRLEMGCSVEIRIWTRYGLKFGADFEYRIRFCSQFNLVYQNPNLILVFENNLYGHFKKKIIYQCCRYLYLEYQNSFEVSTFSYV